MSHAVPDVHPGPHRPDYQLIARLEHVEDELRPGAFLPHWDVEVRTACRTCSPPDPDTPGGAEGTGEATVIPLRTPVEEPPAPGPGTGEEPVPDVPEDVPEGVPEAPPAWREEMPPILPAWARSWRVFKAQARAQVRRTWYRFRWHLARTPFYAARLVWQILVGTFIGIGLAVRWLFAAEYGPLVGSAREKKDWEAQRDHIIDRGAVVKSRFQIAGTFTLVILGGLGLAALFLGRWILYVLAALVLTTAAVTGRRRIDTSVLDTPQLPARIDLNMAYLDSAFRATGLLKGREDDENAPRLQQVSPVMRDGRGWAVTFDLPRGAGKTAADALAKRDGIAAELGVDEIQVHMARVRAHAGGHAGRISMWVADDDPYIGEPNPSPLARAEQVSIWDPIPFGADARGTRVALDIVFQSMFFGGLPRRGKALALDTPVPTPAGWTTMGELADGDQVYDEAGQPCTVMRAHAVRYGRPCYEVEFSDGTVIVADAEHLWQVDTRASRMSAAARAKPKNPASPFSRSQQHKRALPQVLTTEEMTGALYAEGGKRCNFSVPVAAPLAGGDADLPVPPYTLGAWLGDGTTVTGAITNPDPEVIAEIEAEGEDVALVPSTVAAGKCPGWRVYGLSGRLRDVGVLGDKHIPVAYLRASEAQRRALLAGLLDTDGYCTKTGNAQFAVTSERLARDMRHLVSTLGYKSTLRSKPARLNGKDCGTSWIVTFTPANKVFRLPRKAARQVTTVKASSGWRYITGIRSVESVPVRCITVDSPNSLYLVGDTCIPTHNTFSQRLVSAAGVLDPHVRHYVADGKGGSDWAPMRAVAHRLVVGAEDDAIDALKAMLHELIAEMEERFTRFRTLPPSICPESKITPEICKRYSMPIIFVTIDELQEYFVAMDKEDREKVIDQLCRIARRGPAAGFICNFASQRPDAESVPPKLRDIITYRYSTQVIDRRSSDMVLGSGKAVQGADASILAEEHKGVGVLVTGPASFTIVRCDYMDNTPFIEVCGRGRALRQAAGTLTGDAAGDLLAIAAAEGRVIPPVLSDVLAAMQNSPRIHTADLLARLVNLDEQTYGDFDPDRLAAELDAAGVRRTMRQVKIGGVNLSGWLRSDLDAAADAYVRLDA